MSSDSQPYQHMLFMLQAIEFLLAKVCELYRLQAEQEQQPRKKSIIRILDKSVERLPPTPPLKFDIIQPPIYEESDKIMQEIQAHKRALLAAL
jgi:hypothetical protein